MITPRTLKGFRDDFPETMLIRERITEICRSVFRSFGFGPIDTPALEYLEILQGKGSEETDKQLYKFEDHGGRWVGLRFDLTVPLARFAAQHVQVLGTPFKRYHIAKVWRGENPQSGRFREFTQCDFDTIGTTSVASDIETALVMHDILSEILQGNRFAIHINNRKVLSGLLEKLNLSEKTTSVLRALDKIGKTGKEKVLEEMVQSAGITSRQAENVLRLSELSGTNEEVLEALCPLVSGNSTGEEGVGQLETLLNTIKTLDIPEGNIVIDVSIARGLEYYTGTIYETFLLDLPEIGSVCSGGRYDNLAGLYTKQQLPGVGASLGLDRLLAGLEQLGRLEKTRTAVEVFLPFFDATKLGRYMKLAGDLRAHGIGVEFYPEPKKLGQQLKYADKKGFTFALILGENEWEKGVCQCKNLKTAASEEIALDSLVAYLEKKLR